MSKLTNTLSLIPVFFVLLLLVPLVAATFIIVYGISYLGTAAGLVIIAIGIVSMDVEMLVWGVVISVLCSLGYILFFAGDVDSHPTITELLGRFK